MIIGVIRQFLSKFEIRREIAGSPDLPALEAGIGAGRCLWNQSVPVQAKLYAEVCRLTGERPPVIDSSEFLRNPRAMLEALCAHFDIEFVEQMLHWPGGPRDSDGVWARYWYDSVWQSTGFAPYRERTYELPEREREIAQAALPYYEDLYQYRLVP